MYLYSLLLALSFLSLIASLTRPAYLTFPELVIVSLLIGVASYGLSRGEGSLTLLTLTSFIGAFIGLLFPLPAFITVPLFFVSALLLYRSSAEA